MKLPLHQGFYEARSPIANAQACINLYGESNPPDAPFPVTHYPAPGLSMFINLEALFPGPPEQFPYVRGLYCGSDGDLYGCIGNGLFQIVSTSAGEPLAVFIIGYFPTDTQLPVSICDNGSTVVAVDGSGAGVMWPLGGGPNSGVPMESDPAFYGSNRVDFIDTFMIFNQENTRNFYTTTSNVVLPFDPTYFAAKEGWNDRLVCAACLHDNIWLLGNATTEIWFNAGGTAFPFARMPNSVLQQGCAAIYSAIIVDNALYWLSQDRWGHAMVMRGEGYAARRVSTFAVEQIWNTYQYVQDCIGMAYQIAGHETVGFYFPNANAWWAYDASTQLWHQRTYGPNQDAWLPYCTAYWGGVQYVDYPNVMVAGSRLAPQLLTIDRNTYTDVGVPIIRQRAWPHMQQDGQRIAYTRFAVQFSGAEMNPDTLALDWSDDIGQTFGMPVNQTINNQWNGQYLWRRLGYGRNRVYRLTWSGDGEFALNGAYSDGIPQGT